MPIPQPLNLLFTPHPQPSQPFCLVVHRSPARPPVNVIHAVLPVMEPVVAERPESDHAGYERSTDNKHNGRESDGDGDDDDDCNEHVGEESQEPHSDVVDEVEPGGECARKCTGVEGVGVVAVAWSLASRKRGVECWSHGGFIALLAEGIRAQELN